jgi:hypothetical protein
MTTYTWTISQCDRRTADGFINVAHWRCTGVDGSFSGSVYSTCSFDGSISIPYESVTEADVLGWCWANGVDKDATEVAVAAQIEAQKNPVEASGLPWNEPKEPMPEIANCPPMFK